MSNITHFFEALASFKVPYFQYMRRILKLFCEQYYYTNLEFLYANLYIELMSRIIFECVGIHLYNLSPVTKLRLNCEKRIPITYPLLLHYRTHVSIMSINSNASLNYTVMASAPTSTQNAGSAIFLQSKFAQCIAGTFVWIALFLTCQQVCFHILIFLRNLSSFFLEIWQVEKLFRTISAFRGANHFHYAFQISRFDNRLRYSFKKSRLAERSSH